ncbi:MAG: tRNA (N(6)-L-threonylcarbamoyladenosine(37)-C(2))-methylthiotransferase [Candidatus Nezhaarchaeales archaeon]
MASGVRVYFETYGCWLNKADTALMIDLVKQAGVQVVDSINTATVMVINTCAVRSETELRILQRIKQLESAVKKGLLRLVITGCLVSYRPGLVSLQAPYASLLGPNAINRVVEAVSSRDRIIDLGPERRTYIRIPRLLLNHGLRYVVPIAVGCLGKCSYCVMPMSRGPLRSYPQEEVVKHVEYATRAGAKEVYLVAQDAGVYGFDIGSSLPSLIKRVCNIDGEFKVRVGMMEPSATLKILDALLDAYEDAKVYKFLHCPVQSGSDKVLRAMNRGYTVNDFKAIASAFRERFPRGVLATDVMVGLPGEENVDFQDTCNLIRSVKPDKVHVARFSPRPLTLAAKMVQVPEPVKKARSKMLTAIVNEVTLQRNREMVGLKEDVLITGVGVKGNLTGRAPSYRFTVVRGKGENLVGLSINVLIKDASPYYVIGEPLSNG